MHPCTKRLAVGSCVVVAITTVMFISIKAHYQQQHDVEVVDVAPQQTISTASSEVSS